MRAVAGIVRRVASAVGVAGSVSTAGAGTAGSMGGAGSMGTAHAARNARVVRAGRAVGTAGAGATRAAGAVTAYGAGGVDLGVLNLECNRAKRKALSRKDHALGVDEPFVSNERSIERVQVLDVDQILVNEKPAVVTADFWVHDDQIGLRSATDDGWERQDDLRTVGFAFDDIQGDFNQNVTPCVVNSKSLAVNSKRGDKREKRGGKLKKRW